MKEPVLIPFMEGVADIFRFAFHLFRAVGKAIASVTSDFINGTLPESSREKSNV
jgi:hypothetical protein